MDANTIKIRLNQTLNAIRTYEHACHRTPGSVTLLAVTKGQSIEAIQHAIACGQSDFGESYLQEAQVKIRSLEGHPITWHYIGAIQSNKTKAIAHNFGWVHSVCSEKIAIRLNRDRASNQPPLNVCLQINLNDEAGKSGTSPEKAPDLVGAVLALPRLKLRGLMLIPPKGGSESQQTQTFIQLQQLLNVLNQQYNIAMDTLSMGMSHDFKAAICAGSTIVRIGQAIFGERI